MEKIYTTSMLPFIFILLFSCSMDAIHENLEKEGEHGFNFKESKKEWDKLKKRNGNSYEYTILEQSWTGYGSETTIEVIKGKVVGRTYIAFIISENDGSKEITHQYEERSKKEIGKHDMGAPPVTIDELYRTCVSQYLRVDQEANEVYFETNEEGVMILCGYVPVGCQDDCYRGIRISNFTWK